jgi:hypothetical protein
VQERAWYKEAWYLLDSLPAPTPTQPEQFTAMIITNYSFHWDGRNEVSETAHGFVAPKYARHPLPQSLLGRIGAAVGSYGRVPPEI